MGDDWDPEHTEKIYKYIHAIVSESVGRVFLEAMTGMKETDFDRSNPKASLTKFVDLLSKWLGEKVTDGVLLNVSKEFQDRESSLMITELRAPLMG
jgi:hypothetical protein